MLARVVSGGSIAQRAWQISSARAWRCGYLRYCRQRGRAKSARAGADWFL